MVTQQTINDEVEKGERTLNWSIDDVPNKLVELWNKGDLDKGLLDQVIIELGHLRNEEVERIRKPVEKKVEATRKKFNSCLAQVRALRSMI